MNQQQVQRTALFVAGRELNYARNDVLVRALRRNGWEVDVVGTSRPVRSITRTSLMLAPTIVSKLRRRSYRFVIVGFYGYLLMPLVRLFAVSPVIFDAFVSNFDTLCFDRKVVAPNSWLGHNIYRFDRWVCNLADHLLLDTMQHADYFIETFALNPQRISWVPVGCNEEVFHPRKLTLRRETTRVLHYSTFLPLHGIDVILQAANQLRSYPIHFRLIGNGPLYPAMVKLARRLALPNVEFIPPVSINVLAAEIADADICLGGHFGNSGKSQRVVPGKIYQMMASQRAIIAADSPANRQLLSHGRSALLIAAGQPSELANSILCLHENPHWRDTLAADAYNLYQTECSEQVIAAKIQNIIRSIVE